MRRSTPVLLLAVVAALLASLFASPGSAAPTAFQPAGIPHEPDRETGNLYVAPTEFFEGEAVDFTANFPTEAAGLDVTLYKETSPGSGDYAGIGTKKADAFGNARILDYTVDEVQEVFARTSDGDVTETKLLEPKTVDPGACNETGNLYVDPAFITPGQEVKLTANFPSDQSAANVAFFKKVGNDMTPIGSAKANSYGNAYLSGHEVDEEQVVRALSSKGPCTKPLTLTPKVINPDSFPQTGTLSANPSSVFDGRTTTVRANFASGSFDITLFEETEAEEAGDPPVWSALGTRKSDSSGNASFTGVKIDGTEKLFALSGKGERTEVDTIVPKGPNQVTGGPSTLGANVVYVTTDSGKTPVTKGVDYEGKAVLETNEVATETLDLETIAVRGNSSADKAKKPYKLKFEDKQKPFGMKNDKTWILLANYGDWTLIRSMVAWDLGMMLDGLKWTPDSTFAELYLNGKYLGSYQMVESIKIDKNRVNVSKTTGQVIEFDPHYKEDGVPGMVGKTGVDYAWKDPDEFKTLDGGGEDPEGLTTAKVAAMKTKIRAFEDVLYGPEGSRNWATYQPPAPENDWMTYLDLNSAVDYYLAREFTKDNDADMYRSNFFYTNNVDSESADKFFMGPIWDFDRSAGAKPDGGSTTITKTYGWWMRGNGSQNHDTNKIHWYTRITDDPRFLEALRVRWAAKKQHFENVAASGGGVTTAVESLGGSGDYELGKQVAANDRAVWKNFGSRYAPKTSSYTGEIAWVKNWYAERYTWMNAQLVKNPPVP